MGRIIAVEYNVPVLCWVDIEEGTISQVTEHVEAIEPTGRLVDENAEYFEDASSIEVATQIANDNDWPAWDKGY
jgi:hypothetical protein